MPARDAGRLSADPFCTSLAARARTMARPTRSSPNQRPRARRSGRQGQPAPVVADRRGAVAGGAPPLALGLLVVAAYLPPLKPRLIWGDDPDGTANPTLRNP